MYSVFVVTRYIMLKYYKNDVKSLLPLCTLLFEMSCKIHYSQENEKWPRANMIGHFFFF